MTGAPTYTFICAYWGGWFTTPVAVRILRIRTRVAGGKHLLWHSRGYRPHLDAPGATQSITFRLADSVPAALIRRWRAALRDGYNPKLRRRIAKYETQGYGACYLGRPEIAKLVQDELLFFDRKRYRLLEWCVMPNHVHVLIEQVEGAPLSQVVKSWKAYTSRRANLILRRSGPFWMRDYFDRYIRNREHLATVRRYIRWNPVRAGLCDKPGQWPWSSAGWRARR